MLDRIFGKYMFDLLLYCTQMNQVELVIGKKKGMKN